MVLHGEDLEQYQKSNFYVFASLVVLIAIALFINIIYILSMADSCFRTCFCLPAPVYPEGGTDEDYERRIE
jgi:hypothetical protein